MTPDCSCMPTDLSDVCMVGSRDKLFHVCQAVGLGKGKDKLGFHKGFPCLLAGHLQELDQVLPVVCE